MKKIYLVLIANLLVGVLLCEAQPSARIILTKSDTNPPLYYSSSGNINIDKIVAEELENLSASFLVKPHIYFYTTGKDSLLKAYKINPQAEDYNVFVDLNMISYPLSAEMKSRLKISLTNQFAAMISKKYKLGLDAERECLFSYYILGYFLNKNDGNADLDNLNDETFKLILASADNVAADSLVNRDDRSSCLKQGYDDSIFASKKRIYVTLKQVINRGLDFLSNQDQ